jgi:hypothetical protein
MFRACTAEPLVFVWDATTEACGGRAVSGTPTKVSNSPPAPTATPDATGVVSMVIDTGLHGGPQNPEPVTLIVVSGGP